MKKRLIKISLIAVTCFGVLVPATSQAQNPLDKLIPRGTLLKKLKNEIVGEFNKSKAKVPTAAVRPDQGKAPSARPVGKEPTLATRPLPPMNSPTPAANQQRATQTAPRRIAPTSLNASTGFGVVLQAARNNDLVVTRLHPQGNAIEAGLKPGDVVKTVGSVKIGSIEEYDQITKGLKSGEQMEFEFVRRGKPGKVLVPFGEVSEEQQVSMASGQMDTTPMSSTSANVGDVHISSNIRQAPSVLSESLNAPVRVSRLPQSAPSVVTQKSESEQRLARMIKNQQAQMERMQAELEMLRRTTTPAIAPVENNWSVPDLSAPN